MAFPQDGTAVQNSASGGNTSNTATLAAVVSKTNYLTGMIAVIGGATAALQANIVTTGLQGGNLTIPVEAQAGAGLQPQVIQMDFNPPIPATGQNVAITANLPALGAGNTCAGITLLGQQA